MFFSINKKLDKLISILEQKNLQELIVVLGSKKEIVKRNFLAGISRGIGVGIGVTIITAILVMILNKIVTLNIPIIGEYVSEIVKIVEKNNL